MRPVSATMPHASSDALAGGRRSDLPSSSVSVMADRIVEETEARSLQVRSPDALSARVPPSACMDDPFTLLGARVIGLGVPMGCEGCPPPSKGRPPHVGGHSLLP